MRSIDVHIGESGFFQKRDKLFRCINRHSRAALRPKFSFLRIAHFRNNSHFSVRFKNPCDFRQSNNGIRPEINRFERNSPVKQAGIDRKIHDIGTDNAAPIPPLRRQPETAGNRCFRIIYAHNITAGTAFEKTEKIFPPPPHPISKTDSPSTGGQTEKAHRLNDA